MLKKVICFSAISMTLFSLNAQASIETFGFKELTKEWKDKIEKIFSHNDHSEEITDEEETLAHASTEHAEENKSESEEEEVLAACPFKDKIDNDEDGIVTILPIALNEVIQNGDLFANCKNCKPRGKGHYSA